MGTLQGKAAPPHTHTHTHILPQKEREERGDCFESRPQATIHNMFFYIVLSQWGNAYLMDYGNSMPDAEIHSVFYSVVQSIFYIFCFKYRFFVETSEGRAFLQQLGIERFISAKLNPFKVLFLNLLLALFSSTKLLVPNLIMSSFEPTQSQKPPENLLHLIQCVLSAFLNFLFGLTNKQNRKNKLTTPLMTDKKSLIPRHKRKFLNKMKFCRFAFHLRFPFFCHTPQTTTTTLLILFLSVALPLLCCLCCWHWSGFCAFVCLFRCIFLHRTRLIVSSLSLLLRSLSLQSSHLARRVDISPYICIFMYVCNTI